MGKAEHQTPAPDDQTIRTPGADTSRPAMPGPEGVASTPRGGDGLIAFLAAADVDRRADITLAMQRTAGNRTVTRMIAAPGPTGARLQRDPLDEVKKVRSFNVEEKQAGQATLQTQLDRRLKKRTDEITAMLARRRTRPASRRCPMISPSRSTTSSRPGTPRASTPSCVRTSSNPPPLWGRPRRRPRLRSRRGRSSTTPSSRTPW